MMLMKLIFNYKRGQDRMRLVDTIQNNNMKNKTMHLSELTEKWSAISMKMLKQFAEVLPTTFILWLVLNQIFEVST